MSHPLSIDQLDQRTRRALNRAGIYTLRDLTRNTRAHIRGLRGIGKRSMTAIDDLMAERAAQYAQPAKEGDRVRIHHPGNPNKGQYPVTIEGQVIISRGESTWPGRSTFIEIPWFNSRLYAGPDMGYGWEYTNLTQTTQEPDYDAGSDCAGFHRSGWSGE